MPCFYIFQCIFVCLNASISGSIRATDIQFGSQVTAYQAQLQPIFSILNINTESLEIPSSDFNCKRFCHKLIAASLKFYSTALTNYNQILWPYITTS